MMTCHPPKIDDIIYFMCCKIQQTNKQMNLVHCVLLHCPLQEPLFKCTQEQQKKKENLRY
jgi:hypothetical protein